MSGVQWRCDLDSASWDRTLAQLGGHPLQSALWGDARQAVGGIADERWCALRDNVPVCMARIERRPLGPFGWVGWAPRGPVDAALEKADLLKDLGLRLRPHGMVLLVADRWRERRSPTQSEAGPRTVWIDLTIGLDGLSRSLDKQWRYGVGRAKRLGVTVDSEVTGRDLAEFWTLCRSIGARKQFPVLDSPDLVRAILGRPSAEVEARLFLARYKGKIGAGAFTIRSGRSIHYFWGGVDRDLSDSRSGEAVQWAVIEWGVAQGCTLYDLEGIDRVRNPGTYAFKKKMGGNEIALEGHSYFPNSLRGQMIALVSRSIRR